MKKIVLIVVLIVAGWLAWNYFSTGSLSLFPGTVSEDEVSIGVLEDRLATARTQFAQAGRGAAFSGVDTTADAENARIEIDAITQAADRLAKRPLDDRARARLDRLKVTIQQVRKEIGIR